MQEIDDLKEIFNATHDLGVAWQNTLIELTAENSRLIEENKNLQTKYEKLVAENKNLMAEIKTLSEKIKSYKEEIIRELDAKNREAFQNLVKNHLEKIRECVDGTMAFESFSTNEKYDAEKKSEVVENLYD